MPNLKRPVILLLLCICFFMTASCAFAADSAQLEDIGLADAEDFEIDFDVETDFGADECVEADIVKLGSGLEETYALENESENDVEVAADGGAENTVPATYNDLRDDIENLNDGDVYDIQRDYSIADCDSELSKNRAINIYADNVVINGNGHSINANKEYGYFAVFKIIGNNVTIVNLNILNSRARNNEYSTSAWNRYGDDYTRVLSPVEWYGDDGVLQNCKFNDNAGEDGGAIYWVGNNGVIDNCMFNENIAARGGAIFIGGNDNTISNSIFFNSNSDSMDTIFIKNFDDDKTLTLNVNNCNFLNMFGQSVDDFHTEGSCVVMNGDEQVYPVITDEEPIEITEEEYAELRDIIFDLRDGDIINITKDYYFDYDIYNYIYPISANNVTVYGNGHRIYANKNFNNPLIWINGANVTVRDLIFEFNQTCENFTSSFFECSGENGTLINCTFIGNYAEKGGAVIWSGKRGVIDGCTFIENYAENGGAVQWTGRDGTIENCYFINNNAADGGAIKWTGRDGTIENSYFVNNNAVNGGAVTWSGKKGAIRGSIFSGSYAENGGAVKWTGNSGVIDDCLFINNTADVSGGAIFINGKSNLINNTMLFESSASGYGDAIFIDYGRKNLVLSNIFVDNIEGAVFDEGIIGNNMENETIASINYHRWIAGTSYEISSLIYNSIITGGMNYLDDGSYYYAEYYKDTGDFIFYMHSGSYVKYGLDYSQSFHFKNIKNYNYADVFAKLQNNDYETAFTVIETVYVNNAEDYLKALAEFYMPENLWQIEPVLEGDYVNANNVAETNPLTFGMNVVFSPLVQVGQCTVPWDMTLGWFDILRMEGQGSYISGTYDEDDEYIWVIMGEGDVLYVTDLTIAGFNTAVENMGGQCVFSGVNFAYNKMDYVVKRDWGGAILNTGMVTCIGCTFSNNYAKNGGAIFNQGMLVLQDCTFVGNEAYGEGNDVCVGEGGMVIIDGVSITEDGQSSLVSFPESLTLAESTVIATFSIVIGAIVATVVSAITLNPYAGMAVGFLVGAAIGTAGASIIIANTYDVNFDRLNCVLTLSIAGGVSGAVVGLFGASFGEGLYTAMFIGGISTVHWTPMFVTLGILYTIPSVVTGISYYCTND